MPLLVVPLLVVPLLVVPLLVVPLLVVPLLVVPLLVVPLVPAATELPEPLIVDPLLALPEPEPPPQALSPALSMQTKNANHSRHRISSIGRVDVLQNAYTWGFIECLGRVPDPRPYGHSGPKRIVWMT